MIYHGDYDLGDLDSTVKETVMVLRKLKKYFDGLIVVGMSGIIVGVPVALALKMPVIVVRKLDDNCHQGGTVVNWKQIKGRLLWLDDFACSGRTRQYIGEVINNYRKNAGIDGHIVGFYLYRDGQIYLDTGKSVLQTSRDDILGNSFGDGWAGVKPCANCSVPIWPDRSICIACRGLDRKRVYYRDKKGRFISNPNASNIVNSIAELFDSSGPD